MSKKIAIVQSNYIPWRGYFDLIASVDEFIIYDDMQFTKRDWRNRNKIKTPSGVQWLTVPVQTKGSFKQKISETRVDGNKWQKDHWNSLTKNYSRAHFSNINRTTQNTKSVLYPYWNCTLFFAYSQYTWQCHSLYCYNFSCISI